MRFVLYLALGTALATSVFASDSAVTQILVPAPQKKSDPSKVPSNEEMNKIMRAFVEREPRITLFGHAFAGTKAEIYFEDRKTRTVRFDTSVEFGDTYDVMLFFSLRLDESLSKVVEYKCLAFGAYFLPPNATNINQSSSFIKFPFEEFDDFCKDPKTYTEEHVRNALKKG